MEGVDPRWRTSSKSGNGGECIEVGDVTGRVLVRDTKQDHMTDTERTTLSVPATVWTRFVQGIK